MNIEFSEEVLEKAASDFKDALRQMAKGGHAHAFSVGRSSATGEVLGVLIILDRREVIDHYLDQAEAASPIAGASRS